MGAFEQGWLSRVLGVAGSACALSERGRDLLVTAASFTQTLLFLGEEEKEESRLSRARPNRECYRLFRPSSLPSFSPAPPSSRTTKSSTNVGKYTHSEQPSQRPVSFPPAVDLSALPFPSPRTAHYTTRDGSPAAERCRYASGIAIDGRGAGRRGRREPQGG